MIIINEKNISLMKFYREANGQPGEDVFDLPMPKTVTSEVPIFEIRKEDRFSSDYSGFMHALNHDAPIIKVPNEAYRNQVEQAWQLLSAHAKSLGVTLPSEQPVGFIFRRRVWEADGFASKDGNFVAVSCRVNADGDSLSDSEKIKFLSCAVHEFAHVAPPVIAKEQKLDRNMAPWDFKGWSKIRHGLTMDNNDKSSSSGINLRALEEVAVCLLEQGSLKPLGVKKVVFQKEADVGQTSACPVQQEIAKTLYEIFRPGWKEGDLGLKFQMPATGFAVEKFKRVSIYGALQFATTKLFTKVLGKSEEEVENFIQRAHLLSRPSFVLRELHRYCGEDSRLVARILSLVRPDEPDLWEKAVDISAILLHRFCSLKEGDKGSELQGFRKNAAQVCTLVESLLKVDSLSCITSLLKKGHNEYPKAATRLSAGDAESRKEIVSALKIGTNTIEDDKSERYISLKSLESALT